MMPHDHTGSAWADTAGFLYTTLQPFIWPAMLALMGWGITVLRRAGYQTTYAAALARAVGAGVLAAQDRNLNPFTGEGRVVAVLAGVDYLKDTVTTAASNLGINTDAEHTKRVTAQLGTVAARLGEHQ